MFRFLIIFLAAASLTLLGCGDDSPWKHDPPKSYRGSSLEKCFEDEIEGETIYVCVYEDKNCNRRLEWSGESWEEGYWVCYY